MKLKVGVVGLGPSWQSRHRPALSALASRYDVRAVCDPVARRADQVASEMGARSIDGFRALAAAEDIEAVLMLSGRWFGALPILAACDAGKAVYCGASVEMPCDEAHQLRTRVRQAGIAFMAELPYRLAPATVRLKELIATRLGPVQLLFCNERHAGLLKDRATEGEPRLATHTRRLIEMVDWCRYMVGTEVTSVLGVRHEGDCHHGQGTEDYTLAALEFELPEGTKSAEKPVAQIACGGYVPSGWKEAASFRRPADLQVVCDRGIAFLDLPNSLVWFDDAGQHSESLDQERPLSEQLLMQFHRSVASLVLRAASLEDSIRALSIVLAAERSADEGRRIDCVPDF